jgi:hypothetical protein
LGKTVLWGISILILLVSCQPKNILSSETGETVSLQQVEQLICGSQTGCLPEICEDIQACPLVMALSDPVIFDFVKTYSQCEGCAVPVFSLQNGIGKCIEYEIITPIQTSMLITIDTKTSRIIKVKPDGAYIQDPSYCKIDSDCKDLFGSGVPFIGCSNFFYAPLNWSGYGINETCICNTNQCLEK